MEREQLDIFWMQRAIELAKQGRGWVNPNPRVGCVVVKDGRCIAEGYHPKYGAFHAERNALLQCNEDASGATLYVTLEPCCHYGKTPPCTDIIIERGIARVVIGVMDPNPLVAGKGATLLREAGIEVESGVCEAQIRELNKVFLHYITTKRPYVMLKMAQTLDGKIATATGDSRWVSCEASRQQVHALRGEMMAVMVGSTTALKDDPMLNCRIEGAHQPWRIVVSSGARLPLDSQLVKTAGQYPTLVAHTECADADVLQQLQEAGVETLCCAMGVNGVDPRDLLQRLGEKGIDSVLLEGGATLNASFLKAGLVDELQIYIAPKMVGGADALGPVASLGIEKMESAVHFALQKTERVGDDVLLVLKKLPACR